VVYTTNVNLDPVACGHSSILPLPLVPRWVDEFAACSRLRETIRQRIDLENPWRTVDLAERCRSDASCPTKEVRCAESRSQERWPSWIAYPRPMPVSPR